MSLACNFHGLLWAWTAYVGCSNHDSLENPTTLSHHVFGECMWLTCMSPPCHFTVFPIKRILHSISIGSILNIKHDIIFNFSFQLERIISLELWEIVLMQHQLFLIRSLKLGLHVYKTLMYGLHSKVRKSKHFKHSLVTPKCWLTPKSRLFHGDLVFSSCSWVAHVRKWLNWIQIPPEQPASGVNQCLGVTPKC